MKVKNSWKRVVAGVLAVLVMAGAAPGGVDLGGLFGGSSIVASADYEDGSLVVVNTSVTSTITNGDGWSFDADNNTLTLNGANITQCGEETGCGIYYGGSSPLSIVLVGDNTIDISSTNGGCGILAMASLINISGTGELTVKGKSQGIVGFKGVNFNGGTVDVEAEDFAVNSFEVITIGNATVTATSKSHALAGRVKNSIAGKGWSNAAGTEDETAIEVSETGRDLAYYKKVQFTATAASPYTDFIPAASDSDDVLTGKQVTFGGKQWHIIKDESTSATEGTVTLLLASNSLGSAKFDENGSNVYDNSSIKTRLDSLTTTGVFKNFADAIKDTENGKVYLLSDTEAEEVPQNLRKAFNSDAWWLRTAAAGDSKVKYVYVNDDKLNDHGRIVSAGVPATTLVGARPALQLDLSKVVFDADSKTFNLPATAPTVNSVTGTTLVKGYTTGSVSVSATEPTGHTRSYQWYSNTTDSNEGGTKIEGATSAKYNIETGKDTGTYYYYCVVTATRTDNSQTASVTSDAAAVTVAADTDKLIEKLAQDKNIDLNDYYLIPAEDMYYTRGEHWSKGDIFGRHTNSENEYSVATKQFTIQGLPEDSVIFCKPYYSINVAATADVPATSETIGKANYLLTKIKDQPQFSQWTSYKYFGINLTKYVEGSFDTKTAMTPEDLEHMSDIFRIYVPKSEAVAKIGNNSYSTLADAVRDAQPSDTIVLQRDTTENLVLTQGQEITFDLNGFTLTNDGKHNTIITQIGSTLTLTDSSVNKTGKVDNTENQRAPLFNNGGTVILNGGTFTRSQEAGFEGGNTYYTVVNHGTMTINEGVVVYNDSANYSSLIANGYNTFYSPNKQQIDPDIIAGYQEGVNAEHPTLTINGGIFAGGNQALKNDVNGIATINGGFFSSSTGNAVYNVGELTISGGEFFSYAEGKFALRSAAESGKTYGPQSAAGNTTVTGGTFFGKLQKDDDAYMAISGGEFSEVVPENYCAQWYVPVTTKNDHEMYTVSLAPATVTTAPTAKENLKYNGNEQELINAGTSEEGTVQYAVVEGNVQDEDEINEDAWSDVIPKGTDAGDYDVYYRVKGDANHKDTAPTKIENVKIARADPTVTTAPTAKENLKYNGELQDLITAGTSEDGTVQYAVVETDDDDTSDYTIAMRDSDDELGLADVKVNTIYTPDLEGKYQGTYGARFSIHIDFIIDDITHTGVGLMYNTYTCKYCLMSDKGILPLPEGCDGLLITDIDSGRVYAKFVNTANPAGEVEIDEQAWVEVIPKETDAGEYNVYYRVKGDANHNNTKPVKIENVKIAKADATVTAPTPLELTYTGKAQALVTEGTTTGGTMMYAVNTDSSTEPTLFTNDIPSETNAGTYYVWYTLDGEDNYNDTDPKCVPVTISKADPTVTAPTAKTLTYNGKAQALVTEGTTTAGTMQYALSASPEAQPKGEYSATVPTAEKAGPYYVWYKVVGDDNYNDAKPKCVTATIAKADPTVTAPTAKTLTYNGSAQALVTAGKTTGGTMQYALSASPVAKPKGEYSATVPTAEKAGPYYVWYKVVGDENYNDAEPKCVTATIKKAVVTVTANNLSKKWGAKDPELTYKATGLVGKDKLTGALTREAGEEVGKYAIKQGTLAANENYTLKFNGAVLTINTAYFKITFVNYDGTVLQSSEVGNGAMPKYTGKTPTKPATAQYTYTFKGWNKTITAVTGAATYKATYNKAVNKTALNTAIKALDALNKTIKNDKQYAEIYKAANEAIAKAKSVANSKTATVEQVAEQTKLLNDMIDNFEAAKKLIRDLAAANKVAKMINELPEAKDVSKADKQAIEAARAGFKALTGFQKKIITQSILYQKLVDDEKALAAALKKVDTTRLSGSDRFATAAEISKASFTKADTVILTFGYSFADALAGVPLATKLNAPILLTEKDTLPKTTLAEIKRLGAKKVIILGGTTAVSEKVEKALANKKLTTERIAGNTRFATATAIAEKLNKKPTDVFFVYGLNFADAMSVSTVAAIKNAPIIYLTKEGKLDADTAAYLAKLKKTGSVKNAYVIGGEAVISNDMASQAAKALGLKKATRVAGGDRFLTSVEVNKKFADVLKGDKICVATGMNFPDALAGGVYAAKNKAPLFLINGNEKTPNLLAEQKSFLKAKNSHDITIFGGTGAVSDNAVKAITDAITEKAKK